MPDYAYRAANASGEIIKGFRFANNDTELATALKESGLHLLESTEGKARGLLDQLQDVNIGGLSRADLIEFSNNMGVMIKAGIPLLHAFGELRDDAVNKYFKKVLGEVIGDIMAGDSLHEAMAKKGRVFPMLYVNVVQIGENTGGLDEVFFDLSRHYKRIDDLINNVRKAMLYPAFVVIALLLAAFVFLTMVFPPLFDLLKDFEVPLPTVTRVVMGVSDVLQNQWPWLLAGIIGFVIVFILLRRNKETKYYIDWVELNIPYVRRLFILLRLAFFMRYLAMLLSAGVDILRALQLGIESVNNLVIQRFLEGCRQRIIEGDLLSESMRGTRFIPNMVTRMIAIGEESGNLPEQMEYVADHYNEELERRIAVALALMEPLLLFMLAGLALALVMGVLLPLYDLVSQLSTGVGGG